jgi:hypothetical protein
MTDSKDKFDDAAFDAFLRGEGELAHKLHELPQPEPSSELDASILAAIELDLVREAAKPVAANDAAIPDGKASRFKYWQAPAAVAACAVFALLVVLRQTPPPVEEAAAPAAVPGPQAYQDGLNKQMDRSAEAEKAAKPVGREAKQLSKAEAVSQGKADVPPPKPEQLKPAVTSAASVAHFTQSPEPPARAADMTPAPASVPSLAMAPAEPASVSGAHAGAAVGAEAKSEYSFNEKTTPASSSPPSVAAYAAAPAARALKEPRAVQPPSSEADAWLLRIEALLDADMSKFALEEWDKFRKSFPNHPVPEKLEARIKVLKEAQASKKQQK